MNNKTTDQFGFVAIAGRPNVGKSTLINKILGKKLCITSNKPQTTRHRILGIKTFDACQIAYIDTPGLHQKEPHAMNKLMNRAARTAIQDVDLIVMLVEAREWKDADQWVLKEIQSAGLPIILVLNKIDQLKNRADLLTMIDTVKTFHDFHKIIPISAKSGEQVEILEQEIQRCLPEEPHAYSPDQLTDKSDRFIAAEMLREQLTRQLGNELPYALSVVVDALEESDNLIKIDAIIWVDKTSQKSIVIGKQGSKLKAVATTARLNLEQYFDKKVFLQTWVKVKSGWSDDQRTLTSLGYE